MPVEVRWFNEEKTILLNQFHGNATVTDYYQSVEDNLKLVNSIEHTFDLIMDLSDAKVDARGMLPALVSANDRVPSHQRHVIVVGTSMYYQVLGNIARSLAPKATTSLHMAKTLEEALNLVESLQAKTN